MSRAQGGGGRHGSGGGGKTGSPGKGGDHDVRVSRVAKAIRDIIANAVIRGLGDVPRGPVTVTRVDVTRDFKTAKVYVSIFIADGTTESEKEDFIATVLDAFSDSHQELVHAVNKQLRLKNVPQFEFYLDTGLEKMARIAGILDTISDQAMTRKKTDSSKGEVGDES